MAARGCILGIGSGMWVFEHCNWILDLGMHTLCKAFRDADKGTPNQPASTLLRRPHGYKSRLWPACACPCEASVIHPIYRGLRHPSNIAGLVIYPIYRGLGHPSNISWSWSSIQYIVALVIHPIYHHGLSHPSNISWARSLSHPYIISWP